MIKRPRCPTCGIRLMLGMGEQSYRQACRAGMASFLCRRCGSSMTWELHSGQWVPREVLRRREASQRREAERSRVSAEHERWEIGPGWTIRTADNADGVEREYRYAGTDREWALHLFRADDGDEQVMFWSRVSGDWTTQRREEYDRRHPGLPEPRWSEKP